MFKVTATRHVLAVNNLQDAEAYFCNKLGFDVQFRTDGWVFLHLGSFNLMLGHCPDEIPASATNDHAHFAYINCENIDEFYQDCLSRGASICQEISDKPWGLREFGVITPEGHRMLFGEELTPPKAD